MIPKENNYAYIDGANLNKGIKSLGWKLDYKRFRIWLKEKYGVTRAYLFIGLIPKYKNLYTTLQEFGFTLIFKEVVYDGSGKPKGNCDADLVLSSARDVYECDINKIKNVELGNELNFEKSVIVASDGDYAGLIKFLQEKKRLEVILSPRNKEKCSVLLKRTNASIVYLNDKRSILMVQNKKAPDADRTA